MSKHTLLMLACCLVPLALIGAINAFQIELSGLLPIAILLICPLTHLLMMRGMGHDKGGHQTGPTVQSDSLSHVNHGSAAVGSAPIVKK